MYPGEGDDNVFAGRGDNRIFARDTNWNDGHHNGYNHR
jgi:hypothetical protein